MKTSDATKDLRVLGRLLVRELGVVDSASSPDDVSLSHCHILVELERSGTLSAKELAERLIVDKAAISRAVADLHGKGLIALQDDPLDKRRRPLALTPAGRKKATEIHRSADRRVSEALALLSSRERQAVATGLSLYVAALNRARVRTDGGAE